MGNNIEEHFFGAKDKKVNSYRKGANNERSLSYALGRWTGKEFTRVPRSGGLRWLSTQNVCGDLICTDAKFNFPFNIETKHYKAFSFDLSTGKNKDVYKAWEQTKSDSERSGKDPIMFLRQNKMPANTWYVFLDAERFNFSEFLYPPIHNVNGLLMYRSEDIFTIKYKKFLKFVL